jgi:hypothetical protein
LSQVPWGTEIRITRRKDKRIRNPVRENPHIERRNLSSEKNLQNEQTGITVQTKQTASQKHYLILRQNLDELQEDTSPKF